MNARSTSSNLFGTARETRRHEVVVGFEPDAGSVIGTTIATGDPMAVELNHTIVRSRDKVGSSRFLAEILGIGLPQPVGGFMAVQLSNGVTLDYADADEFGSQHLAFLVGDDEFDAIFDRVTAAGITYYADPFHRLPGELRRRDGGRGFYFDDPDGHNMEVFSVVPAP